MATLQIREIISTHLPELDPFRTLRRRKDLERQRLFVVEGEKVVLRFLKSQFPLISLLLTPEWLDRIQPLLECREDFVQVFLAGKSDIEKITGFTSYQEIKAVGRIDKPATLHKVLAATGRPRLFVAVDGVSNAENLGVIVRNCAAFGVQALFVGETAASPFLTRAIRTSMGAIFRLPAVETDSLVQSLADLKQAGMQTLAAHPHGDRRRLTQADFREDCCVVFGSEGLGISPEVLNVCDETVAIPMGVEVDSLNVATASAVFLYEAMRQRGRM